MIFIVCNDIIYLYIFLMNESFINVKMYVVIWKILSQRGVGV